MTRDPLQANKIVDYPGGKHFLAKWIISMMPEHEIYIEPFAGGASVIFKKKRVKIEILNDINDDLITFFKVLRDDGNELKRRAYLTPASRTTFNDFVEKMAGNKPFDDDVDRALAVFFLSKNSGIGIFQKPKVPLFMPAHFNRTGYNTRFNVYTNSVNVLDVFASRARDFIIECLDFREILSKYDTPRSFFYLDPPYTKVSAPGSSGYYLHTFTWQDHVDLSEMLKNLQGRFILSYGEDKLIEELYKDFWIERREFHQNAGKLTLSSQDGSENRVRTELAILNYDWQESKALKKSKAW